MRCRRLVLASCVDGQLVDLGTGAGPGVSLAPLMNQVRACAGGRARQITKGLPALTRAASLSVGSTAILLRRRGQSAWRGAPLRPWRWPPRKGRWAWRACLAWSTCWACPARDLSSLRQVSPHRTAYCAARALWLAALELWPRGGSHACVCVRVWCAGSLVSVHGGGGGGQQEGGLLLLEPRDPADPHVLWRLHLLARRSPDGLLAALTAQHDWAQAAQLCDAYPHLDADEVHK